MYVKLFVVMNYMSLEEKKKHAHYTALNNKINYCKHNFYSAIT